MEQQSPFTKEQEEEIHHEASSTPEEVRREAAAAASEGFQWETVEPTSKEVSNYMFKPDYSTHSTVVNNDPKAGKSFWERRVRDGDDLISKSIHHTGINLLDALILKPFILYLTQTKEDKLISKLNNDVTHFTVSQRNSELISDAMNDLYHQVNETKNPRKKAELQGEYKYQNQARKENNRQKRANYKKFADDILKHKKHKDSQPTTIFENRDGQLVTVEAPTEQELAQFFTENEAASQA